MNSIQFSHCHVTKALGPVIAALTLALLVVALPPAAQAAVNKCTGADGTIVFSDQPCAIGQTVAPANKSAKPAATTGKAALKIDLPKEGAAPANSRLQAFDTFCADSRDRLANRPDRVQDNGPESDFQLAKARLDKLCDPAGRLAAAEDDLQSQNITCNESRKSLAFMQEKPSTGYSYRGDVALMEAFIAKNCPTTLK